MIFLGADELTDIPLDTVKALTPSLMQYRFGKNFISLKPILDKCRLEGKIYVMERMFDTFNKDLIYVVGVKWRLINAPLFDYFSNLKVNGQRLAKVYEKSNTIDIEKVKVVASACSSFPNLIDCVIDVRDHNIMEDTVIELIKNHGEIDDRGQTDT